MTTDPLRPATGRWFSGRTDVPCPAPPVEVGAGHAVD